MSIRIDAVSKAYKNDGPRAVDDVTLEVRSVYVAGRDRVAA